MARAPRHPDLRYNGAMRFISSVVFCMALLIMAPAARAETLEGDRFIIEYHPNDLQVAKDTLAWLEAARKEFDPLLPMGDEPVRVKIASNVNEFVGLTGTYAHVGVSGVTRADQSHIALKSPRLRPLGDDYRGTVRHELVHVLLHRNTNTDNLPRWLNEGLCMMLANELRWGSALQVAQMHLTGQLLEPAALDVAFRAPGSDHQFGNAYAQALSMTRHLRDKVGDGPFWSLIPAMRDASFPQALLAQTGMTAQEFWEGYRGGLWGLTIMSILQTGSFWGAVSFLCIFVFMIRHLRNRAILRRWEAGEDSDSGDTPFDWDSVLADSEDWKR